MVKLVKKDLVAGGIFLAGAALMIPAITTLIILAMIKDFGGIILGIFTMIIAFLCVGASLICIAVDAAHNTEIAYASLPVKRSSIVLARYISSVIIILAAFSLVFLSCLASIHIFNRTDPAFALLLSRRGMVSMISFLVILLAVILPFLFRYGPGKGVIMALVVQAAVAMLGPIYEFSRNALEDLWNFDISYFYRMLREILAWTITLPPLLAYLLSLSIVVSFILASLLLSVRFYGRRDL